MLILAHDGRALAPQDLWSAWNPDPLLIGVLAGIAWLYHRGSSSSPRDEWRHRAFVSALGVTAFALLSPLEAMSHALASAHMVQHVLLLVVAAPLFAFSAPASTLLRGAHVSVRRMPSRVRRTLRVRRPLLDLFAHPVAVLFFYVGTLWFWHGATVYDATVGSELVHAIEHASFVVAGILFWRVVLGGRSGRRVPGGAALLLVFGAAMASVLLSALMTFAPTSWYGAYAQTTATWGPDPLTDQQLAGAIMWVPSGLLYVGAALLVFRSWLSDPPDVDNRLVPGPLAPSRHAQQNTTLEATSERR